jgi:CheY-like chemotaxis protein
MHMPFMNGLEMAAKIRQLKICKKLKIVLITADEVSDNKLFDAIIEKPIPVIKLKEMYYE